MFELEQFLVAMSNEDSKQDSEECDYKGSRRMVDDEDTYKRDSKQYIPVDDDGAMAKSTGSSDQYEPSKEDDRKDTGNKGYSNLFCVYIT